MRETGRLFPQVWWKVATYLLFTILIFLVLTFFMGSIVFFVLGDIFSPDFLDPNNLSLFTSYPLFFIGIALAYLTALLVPLSLFKISLLLSIKNILAGKKDDIFKNYFQHSWGFFGKYILLFALIGLYVLLPILIASFLAFALSWVTLSFFDFTPYMGFIASLSLLLVFGGILWTIPRLLSVFFASTSLIHFEKSPREAIAFSQKILVGKKFSLFLILFLLGLFFFLLFSPFLIGDYMMNFGANFSFKNIHNFFSYSSEFYTPSIFASLRFLLSVFLVAPFLVTFSYLLMLRFAKEHSFSDAK